VRFARHDTDKILEDVTETDQLLTDTLHVLGSVSSCALIIVTDIDHCSSELKKTDDGCYVK
jgi:hypothetical protein